MPAVISWAIGGALSLYLRYEVAAFVIKFAFFSSVFLLFKVAMQFIIDTVFSKMSALQLPCMASYIINSLDVLSMINFGLSLWATIYVGRYLLTHLMKMA